MLVGSSMEDDAGPPGGKELFHPGLIADIGNARHELDVRKLLQKLAVDVEEAVFGLLDHEQGCRIEKAQLAAQFRADTAAGAAHGNRPPLDDSCDGPVVQLDRIPP